MERFFMQYPVQLQPDGTGWLVTFPDIPEALTSGATREEALEMAHDALVTAMDFYFEDSRPVPLPSRPKKEQLSVELPISLAAKVLLLNEMLAQKVRPSQLAKKLGTSPQDVNRLVNLHHTSKIDGISSALHALGKRLELSIA
jgi:antitoxin HicB